MGLDDFIGSLTEGLSEITAYIQLGIDILKGFFIVMAPVVEWVMDQVEKFQDLIDKGETTGAIAREAIVSTGMAKFVGSGTVVTEQDLRTIVEQAYKVVKAKRKGVASFKEKEALAVKAGYVHSADLERALQGWNSLLPVR